MYGEEIKSTFLALGFLPMVVVSRLVEKCAQKLPLNIGLEPSEAPMIVLPSVRRTFPGNQTQWGILKISAGEKLVQYPASDFLKIAIFWPKMTEISFLEKCVFELRRSGATN